MIKQGMRQMCDSADVINDRLEILHQLICRLGLRE